MEQGWGNDKRDAGGTHVGTELKRGKRKQKKGGGVIEQLITVPSISSPLSSVVMAAVMLIVSLPAGRVVIILESVTVPFVAIPFAVPVPVTVTVPIAVSVAVSVAIPVTVPAAVPRPYRLTITTAAATHAAIAVKHRPVAAVRGSAIVI
jgi:hypothetical protein